MTSNYRWVPKLGAHFQFCSTVLANRFTLPGIVGRLIRMDEAMRVGGASVKMMKPRRGESSVVLNSKRFEFSNLMDKSCVYITLYHHT